MESGGVDASVSIRRPAVRPVGRGASLSIRLSAAIIAARIDEPRVLTVRIVPEPVEVLPSGPLEIEHRTLEVGLRAWVERQTGQKLGYVEQLYTFGDRDRIETGEAPAEPGIDRRRSGAGSRGAPGRCGGGGVAELVSPFSLGGLARRQAGGVGPARGTAGALGGRGRERRREAPARRTGRPRLCSLMERGAGPGALRTPLRGRTCRGSAARCRTSAFIRAPARVGRAAGRRPPPHSRHRDRPPARQDQIPAGRVRADAAVLHPAAAAAHGRSVVRGALAQAEIFAALSSSKVWSRKPAGSAPRPAAGRRGLCAFAARSSSNAPPPACGCAPRAAPRAHSRPGSMPCRCFKANLEMPPGLLSPGLLVRY